MRRFDLARERLRNQHVTHAPFKRPGDVVRWFGAVQAQDYLGALWAVGLRMQHASEMDIEQALAQKEIVRTWPLRGTLHFVAPEDVRWMLKLLTPRIVAGNANRLKRQFELTDALLGRCKDLFVAALQGGRQLSREEMYRVLETARISTANQRGLHILWRLAQDGVICFGARRGKQQTFVLLDEWIPASKVLEREQALAEVAARYFTSHGPATIQDFVWWSGLTLADAKVGLELTKSELESATIEGSDYWYSNGTRAARAMAQTACLLPSFDESTVGYADRRALFDVRRLKKIDHWEMLVLGSVIVIDGRVVGTWKRRFEKGKVAVTPKPFAALSKSEKRALEHATERYAAFLGLPRMIEK